MYTVLTQDAEPLILVPVKRLLMLLYGLAGMAAVQTEPATATFACPGTVNDLPKVLGPATKTVQTGHTMMLTAGRLPVERTVMVIRYE